MRKALVNVRGWLAFLLPALIPVAAMAEPLILEPSIETVPNTRAPLPNVPADARAGNARILVLPFQPLNPADTNNAWIGRSVQESLVADLTVAAPTRVESSNEVAATADDAIALGRKHGAKFVVAGGFVTAERELRITGQLFDVELGKAIGSLKVTGEPSQIFRMEDGLALQAKAQLLPGQEVAPPLQAQQPPPQQQPQPLPPAPDVTPVPGPTPAGQPSIYAVAPNPPVYGAEPYPYTDNSAVYPYAYPYTDYGYGYGYYPFGLSLGYYYGAGYHPIYHYRNNGGYGHSSGYGYGGISGYSTVRAPSVVGSGSTFRSAATFRAPSIFNRASLSRGSSLGGFHASASFHSSGGGFHGGGSHGGGGHGGHR